MAKEKPRAPSPSFELEAGGASRRNQDRPALSLKRGRPRPDPQDGRKLSDRPFRLRGFLRRPHLYGGEPAPQDRILGLQGFDGGFEDAQKWLVLANGRWLGLGHERGAPILPAFATTAVSALP
jgi:hypothetical protein